MLRQRSNRAFAVSCFFAFKTIILYDYSLNLSSHYNQRCMSCKISLQIKSEFVRYMICHNSKSSFDILICTLILNDLDITYNTLVVNFFILTFCQFMMESLTLKLETTHLRKNPQTCVFELKWFVNGKSTEIVT